MEKQFTIGQYVVVQVSTVIPEWSGTIIGTCVIQRNGKTNFGFLVEPGGEGYGGFDLFDRGVYQGVTSAIVVLPENLR